MKKRFVIALLLVLVPAFTFAHVFQLGPIASYEIPLNFEAEKPFDPDSFNFSSLTVGGDFRFTPIKFLQLQGQAMGDFDKELKLQSLDAYAAANFRFDLFVADLTVGGGLKSTLSNDNGRWTIDGESYEDFWTIVKNTTIFYQGGLSIDFGRFSLSMQGIFPTQLTVEGTTIEKTQSVLDAISPDLSKTKVTVGLLLNIF